MIILVCLVIPFHLNTKRNAIKKGESKQERKISKTDTGHVTNKKILPLLPESLLLLWLGDLWTSACLTLLFDACDGDGGFIDVCSMPDWLTGGASLEVCGMLDWLAVTPVVDACDTGGVNCLSTFL